MASDDRSSCSILLQRTFSGSSTKWTVRASERLSWLHANIVIPCNVFTERPRCCCTALRAADLAAALLVPAPSATPLLGDQSSAAVLHQPSATQMTTNTSENADQSLSSSAWAVERLLKRD